MKKILLLLLFLLPLALSHAQSFSNLDFEYWQGNKFPLYWQHPGMTVTPDSSIKLSGTYSLKAVRLPGDDKMPYGLIFQDIATAYKYPDIRNKKIEVSVQIKSEPLDTGMYVSAFIQMVDLANPAINKISLGNNAAGDGWIKSSASIVLDEIPTAAVIYMGVIVTGYGEIRVDNYRIQVDGEAPEKVAPRVTNLTVNEKKWLERNIIPVADDWTIDKKQFGKKFNDFRIVGIGDNVHGSSSVFKLKNMAARTLIEHEGFTILAIEDSPGVGESLNRFIQGKDSVLRQDEINVMYSNDDFRSFMTWLREYNKSAENKVKVFGADINNRYKELVEEVNKMTSGKYSFLLDSVRAVLSMNLDKFDSRTIHYAKSSFSEAQKRYISENLGTIKNGVPAMDMDEEHKELLFYYIDNLLHYLTYDRVEREKQMAGNISWLLSHHPDEKIIYLAHNSHVGNYPEKTSTGAWLKERYKDKYGVIGTCYHEGTELFKQYTLASGQVVINESVKGSYEHLLNQIEEKCFYLDLNRMRSHKNRSNEWLAKPMLIREYGVEPFNYYYEFSLTDLTHTYDGVLFIKESVSL